MHNTNSQIKFKTSVLKSSLQDHSHAYILVKGTISIAPQEGDNANNDNKEAVFNNFAPFTDCISEINNAQIYNPQKIGEVMQMYNLIEYSYNCSKASRILWQNQKDEPALTELSALLIFLMLMTVLRLNLNEK